MMSPIDEKYLIDRFNVRCADRGYHSFIQDLIDHRIPSNRDIHADQIRSSYGAVDFYDPYDYDTKGHVSFSQYQMRNVVINRAGFVLPSKEWIQALYWKLCDIRKSTDVKILEICCGLGAVAYGLRKCGASVIATDTMTETYNFNYESNRWIRDIKQLDWVKAVEQYGIDVDFLLCAWPREGVTEPIRRLHELNPNAIVIYIGENYGGCTADDEFFDSTHILNDDDLYNADEINEVFTRWSSIHDAVYFVRYDPEPYTIAHPIMKQEETTP